MNNYKKQQSQKLKSMNWLSNALINLMVEKSFSEISICELCEKADLSRRTYYRLFSSKESILYYYMKKLCLDYYNLFSDETDLRLPNVANIFFTYWKKHKSFLLLLKRDNLESLLIQCFTELLPQIYVNSKEKPIPTNDTQIRYYIAIFCAGGFGNLLLEWIEQDCNDQPEYMQNAIQTMLAMNL